MKHPKMRGAWLALGSAALLFGVAACGSSDTDSESVASNVNFEAGTTMAKLADAGEITVGTKYDQPGFGLLNPATQEPEGFDVEIAEIIAGQLGIPADKINWVETVSANREAFIQEEVAPVL